MSPAMYSSRLDRINLCAFWNIRAPTYLLKEEQLSPNGTDPYDAIFFPLKAKGRLLFIFNNNENKNERRREQGGRIPKSYAV